MRTKVKEKEKHEEGKQANREKTNRNHCCIVNFVYVQVRILSIDNTKSLCFIVACSYSTNTNDGKQKMYLLFLCKMQQQTSLFERWSLGLCVIAAKSVFT